MSLSDYFLFTQHSLSTFEQCPLKFKKRYIENLKWDSFPDLKSKRQLDLGRKFHMMAYRYFLGLDVGHDDDCEEVLSWLEILKSQFKLEKGKLYLPEHKLRMSSDMLRLEANCDLLELSEDGGITIWDWKTHPGNSAKNTAVLSNQLADSLQTTVYMYVAKEQSHLICGKDVDYSQIRMRYWQPYSPNIVAEVSYDQEKHLAFGETLSSKIQNILEYDYSSLNNGHTTNHCKRCEFNWFCNNGRVDFSQVSGEDAEVALDFDWNDVGEMF